MEIIVGFQSLRNYSQEKEKLSAKVAAIRHQLNSLKGSLDWEIRNASRIDSKLNGFCKDVEKHSMELSEMASYLERAAQIYEDCENEIAEMETWSLESFEGNSPVHSQNPNGIPGFPWLDKNFRIGPFLKHFPMAKIIQAVAYPLLIPGMIPDPFIWNSQPSRVSSEKHLPAPPSGPTPLEAARIAENVYSGVKGQQVEGGWTIIEVPHEVEGLRMAIYGKENSAGEMEYVIANAGTEAKDLRDWANNGQQLFGESPDVEESLRKAKDFISKHPEAKITFVGHSKGGAEAAINAVKFGQDAIVFNPSWSNLKANQLDPADYTGNITAYVVEGEILDQLVGPLNRGTYDVVYLPGQHTTETPSNLVNGYNAVRNHLMDAVVDGLEEKKEG